MSAVGTGIVGVLVAESATETAVGLAGAVQGTAVQAQTASFTLTLNSWIASSVRLL